ncbi:MAG: hypothetical protein LBU32_07775 [Clostridiales bacterium]|jgi:hypothetical protein|nr:hypothetical protein [Clostridiales bacterium]
MKAKSKTERYIDHINAHILLLIDYSELHASYETDMEYAKGVLNRLHEAMVEVYGGETLGETDGDGGFVIIPGVVRGMDSGKVCLALLELDLSSSGEHWGTDYLCKYGLISQDGASTDYTPRVPDIRKLVTEKMNAAFVPYEYGCTARLPGDIHVRKSALPEAIRDVLNDFHNHSVSLLCEEDEDAAEYDADDEPEIMSTARSTRAVWNPIRGQAMITRTDETEYGSDSDNDDDDEDDCEPDM